MGIQGRQEVPLWQHFLIGNCDSHDRYTIARHLMCVSVPTCWTKMACLLVSSTVQQAIKEERQPGSELPQQLAAILSTGTEKYFQSAEIILSYNEIRKPREDGQIHTWSYDTSPHIEVLTYSKDCTHLWSNSTEVTSSPHSRCRFWETEANGQ